MNLFKKYAKAAGATVAGLILGLQVVMPAAAGATYWHNDVTFCQATGNGDYTKETMTDEDVASTQLTGDNIVPEFTWQNQQYSHNWDAAGQAIWNNDCQAPQQTATLTIKKAANPQHPNFDFNFTSDELGNFALDDDSDPTLANEQTFTGLAAGEYGVRELPQFDWMLKDLTCEGTQDYSVVWDEARVQVNLKAGDNVVCTFTNDLLNALGGFKFNDKNGNGKWDKWEKTLKGWKITLTDEQGQTTSIKTNKDGFYTFTGLKPGKYTVCEEQKAGWVQTFPANNDGCHIVTLTGPGQEISCFHFGNKKGNPEQPAPAAINGSKFNDVNGDTAWNTGEPTMSGWTITLKDAQGNVLATQQTDQNGFYNFTGLAAGTYIVCETQQAGWTRTYPIDDDCHTLTVAAGETITADFGNKKNPEILGRGADTPVTTTATLVNTGASMTLQILFGASLLGALIVVHLLGIRKDYLKG